jgi:hypothetical protein
MADSKSLYARLARRFEQLSRQDGSGTGSADRSPKPQSRPHADEGETATRARAAERERWAAVLSSREARGRVPLACTLLADSNASAYRIRVALATSTAESSPKGSRERTPKNRAAELMRVYNMVIGRTNEQR